MTTDTETPPVSEPEQVPVAPSAETLRLRPLGFSGPGGASGRGFSGPEPTGAK
jgi:hypothetical protein